MLSTGGLPVFSTDSRPFSLRHCGETFVVVLCTSKAFDRVCYKDLISKLSSSGIYTFLCTLTFSSPVSFVTAPFVL